MILLSMTLGLQAYAGSATWNSNPTSDDWNTAANWTPATIPNASTDVATFGLSNVTSLTVGTVLQVDSIVFNPGASAFSFQMAYIDGPFAPSFTFSGAGIVNNSGVVQSFTAVAAGLWNADIYFASRATAGSLTSFVANGGVYLESVGATVHFLDNSSAGSAIFINEDSDYGSGGTTEFLDNSSAANGIFTCQGGEFSGDYFGGKVTFNDSATASNGTFIAEGAKATQAVGGAIDFFSGSPRAADAVLIANGERSGAAGGRIVFREASDGGRSRVELFGTGYLDIVSHDAPGITIGSLEGDGPGTWEQTHLPLAATI